MVLFRSGESPIFNSTKIRHQQSTDTKHTINTPISQNTYALLYKSEARTAISRMTMWPQAERPPLYKNRIVTNAILQTNHHVVYIIPLIHDHMNRSAWKASHLLRGGYIRSISYKLLDTAFM